MLQLIKKILLKKIEDIDTGNSNLSTEEQLNVLEFIKQFNNTRMSKYSACEYLNISRATFDNLVREGKLPKGKHEQGFKELSWYKNDLDKFINEQKE